MAHADEAMDRLLEQHGAIAYGAYWLIVEDIAAAMDSQKLSPEATHSERKWCEIVHLDRRVWRKVLQDLAVHLVEVAESDDGRIRIRVRNINKYKDEYSRKSGHTSDELPGRTEQNRADTEQRRNLGADAPKQRPKPAKDPGLQLRQVLADIEGRAQ